MKKILFALTAMAILTIAFASETQAAPKGGNGPSASKGFSPGNFQGSKNVIPSKPIVVNQSKPNVIVNQQNKTIVNKVNSNNILNKVNTTLNTVYHLKNATKFANGHLYHGKNHSHWHITRFDHRYGCNIFYDPGLVCWFYWCEPDLCYYPVTYCPYRIYCWTPPVVVNPCPCQTATVTPCDIEGGVIAPDAIAPIPEPVVPFSTP